MTKKKFTVQFSAVLIGMKISFNFFQYKTKSFCFFSWNRDDDKRVTNYNRELKKNLNWMNKLISIEAKKE